MSPPNKHSKNTKNCTNSTNRTKGVNNDKKKSYSDWGKPDTRMDDIIPFSANKQYF